MSDPRPNDDDLDPQQVIDSDGYVEPDDDPTPDPVTDPDDPSYVEPADLFTPEG